MCKFPEGCIRDHIVEHTVANKTFSKQQFCIIKGRSTVLQLLNVMDPWTMALDFLKSFDTVPQKRLLKKHYN